MNCASRRSPISSALLSSICTAITLRRIYRQRTIRTMPKPALHQTGKRQTTVKTAKPITNRDRQTYFSPIARFTAHQSPASH